MSLKTILNKQTDFTGEFPTEYAVSGLWRFNDSAPDADMMTADCELVWYYGKSVEKSERQADSF